MNILNGFGRPEPLCSAIDSHSTSFISTLLLSTFTNDRREVLVLSTSSKTGIRGRLVREVVGGVQPPVNNFVPYGQLNVKNGYCFQSCRFAGFGFASCKVGVLQILEKLFDHTKKDKILKNKGVLGNDATYKWKNLTWWQSNWTTWIKYIYAKTVDAIKGSLRRVLDNLRFFVSHLK